MNVYTGIVSLAVAILLIWVGRPNKGGIHPKFLRFAAAPVLYPPIVLVFFVFGVTAIAAGLLGK
jgi:hypothetical protein